MILADPDHLLGEDVEIPPELRDALLAAIRRQRGLTCQVRVRLHFGPGYVLAATIDEPCPSPARARIVTPLRGLRLTR